MLLGVSLDRVPQSGWMLWQIAALALRPLMSQSGLALLYGTELLPGCCGPSARGWVQGLAASAALGLCWDLRLKTLHCTGTERGTRGSPATTETRGGWRGGRAGSQQYKPSVCQQFTWTGFLGLWPFVSQCNFTHTCLCVCVRVSVCVCVCFTSV